MKNNGLKPSVHTYNMIKRSPDDKKILQEMIDSRIYLSGRNFSNLCKYMCRSDTHLSLLKLLAEIRYLRLLSAKALHLLNFDRHADEWNPILDTSSSEDLSDVAASIVYFVTLFIYDVARDIVGITIFIGVGLFQANEVMKANNLSDVVVVLHGRVEVLIQL
ncbi:hypothetical protein GmHk_17G050318 [Glycine max]|nr:hypothetical protein GmHk_17G050318 [Glycine max]